MTTPAGGSTNPQAGNGGEPGTTGAPNPQAGNGGATVNPQAGNSGSGNPQQPQMSLADALSALEKARLENAQHRTENAKVAAELKKLQDAGLSAEQKRDNELSELQTKTLDQELRLQRLTLENAGYRLGGKLGIADIGAALALVQIEHEGEIEYDDKTHQPKNLEKLLQQVVKDHPALAASQAGQARQPASSGGATNPGAGTARTGVITRASYAAMSQQDRILRNKEVQEVLRQNGGRLPD